MKSFFILSAPRSGSTLLATMLGVHSRIVTLMESFWFVAVSPQLKWLQRNIPSQQRPEMMYAFLRTVEALDQLATPREALWNIVDEYQDDPDRILAALVAECVRRTKPSASIWGEKTPPHAFYVSDIQRVFPDACYIYLARNPCANVNSIAKPSYEDYSNDLGVATHLYLRFNQAIEKGLASIPSKRQMKIYYEDLVAHPREELRRCCEFLGVEFEPAMLEHERSKRNLAGLGAVKAAEALTRAFADEWREALTPLQIRCIETFTSRLQIASHYGRTNPRTSLIRYIFAIFVVSGKHLCLRLAEMLVQISLGRPFVWSRLPLMLGRVGRRLRSRPRGLRDFIAPKIES